MEYLADKIRNVCILGHLGSGKTTLGESLLFTTKAIDKKGEVERKNTVSDYLVEEQNNFGFLFMQRIKLELIEYAINYQPKAKNCEQAKLILSLLSRKGETENFPPDYRHRAKLYSEKTNESYFTVLERVLNQIKELKKNQYRLAIFMPIIKKLAKNHLEKYKPHFKKYKKEHIETKPNREILKEINYLAEDKRLINCLTILREEGKI